MATVRALCGLAAAAAGAEGAGWVRVPGGRVLPTECVHEVESGTRVDEAADGALTVTEPGRAPRALPRCNATLSAPRHGGAWKTWAEYKPTSASHITEMTNVWKVPPNPAAGDVGQVLFYWNGIEDGGDSGGSGVLQPVLQFGQDTKNGWGIKAWYVGAGGTVTSKVEKLSSGTAVTGTMTQNDDGSWTCIGQGAGGAPATLTYTGQDKSKFTYAYEVLEAYYVTTDATKYPSTGSITFTNTTLAFDHKAVDPPFAWETYSCPSGPGCASGDDALLGEKTTTSDDGRHITIQWNTK